MPMVEEITFDRVLAFDLIESERSPPKFFTAPAIGFDQLKYVLAFIKEAVVL